MSQDNSDDAANAGSSECANNDGAPQPQHPIPLDPASDGAPPVGSTLSALARQRAAEELGETDETRGPALAALRDRVVKDAQLSCRTDDAFLIKFLRHRKFSVESAHQRIRAYLQVRNNLPEVFANFTPEGARSVLSTGLVTFLPGRDTEGRLIVLCRIGRWDCGRVPRVDLLRAVGVLMEAALEEEETQVNGVCLLLDLSGLSLRQLVSINRDSYMKRVREVVSKALPVRVKQIHMLRGGKLFDVGFRLLSFLLSAKMRQRLQNHGTSVASLHRAVDPALLPREAPLCGTADDAAPPGVEPFTTGRFDLLAAGGQRWERWFVANNQQRMLSD